MSERMYVLKISPADPDPDCYDYDFTVIRHNDPIKTFTDTMLIGLDRAKEAIALDLSNDPME